jgi:site-specific DNA recombinase
VYRKSGAPLPMSTVHSTLRNRGRVRLERPLHLGKHQPLVTRELWERVQGFLDGRHATRHRRVKRDFAWADDQWPLGCSMVGR